MHSPLDKGLARYSSILAWRIPWKQEPGALWPMGLQRDTAEHAGTSQLQDGLVREGGAALTFAPNGIPLELKQERWAAGVLLPANKRKREGEVFKELMSFIHPEFHPFLAVLRRRR